MKNYIGCSGFVYSEWKGKFYPTSTPQSKWLSYYSTKFNTVELNGTFYRFPTVKNLQKFYSMVPEDFKFSVKVQKIVTHTLKMKNAAEKAKEFINIVDEGLGKKRGCFLFQLPPSFAYSEENLDHVLSTVPHTSDSVVEFRNISWWDEKVFAAFKKHHLTFCNVDINGLPSDLIITSDVQYMRFHGQPILYKSSYSHEQLKKFQKQLPQKSKKNFVYFNNTWYGAAIENATWLINSMA